MPIPGSGEGGGPNPPYGEDFFDRIVGVHWPRRGAAFPTGIPIFANGNPHTNFQHIILARKDAGGNPVQFTSGPNPIFKDSELYSAGINASSGHLIGPDTQGRYSSIMLLGGIVPIERGTAAVIAASVNGGDWTQAHYYRQEGPVPELNDTDIQAMVYDEKDKSFYAGGFASKYRHVKTDDGGAIGRIEATYFELLYSSVDGLSWSETGRRQIWDSEGNPPPGDGSLRLFMPHCNNAANLQDGVFGHYEVISKIDGSLIESLTAVPASPPSLETGKPVFTPTPSIDITYYKRGGEGFSRTVNAPFPVNAVAYVGEVLVATGGAATGDRGQTAVSFDLGKTWIAIYGPYGYNFGTVCGGFMGK